MTEREALAALVKKMSSGDMRWYVGLEAEWAAARSVLAQPDRTEELQQELFECGEAIASQSLKLSDIRARLAASEERKRQMKEGLARLVESHISTNWCGTAEKASEQCERFCENYGCSTLREIAKEIREYPGSAPAEPQEAHSPDWCDPQDEPQEPTAEEMRRFMVEHSYGVRVNLTAEQWIVVTEFNCPVGKGRGKTPDEAIRAAMKEQKNAE